MKRLVVLDRHGTENGKRRSRPRQASSIGAVLLAYKQPAYARRTSAVRDALDAASFDAVWAAGRSMAPQSAVAEALRAAEAA
jgi:hypothetical protein